MRFDSAGSHKVWVAVLVCIILPANLRMKWLLRKLDMRFDCAGSLKVWVAFLGNGILVNFRMKFYSSIKWLL
jgi:hypothetical protein